MPAQDLATPAPVNGLINYPQHIQPIWSRDRGANTCTGCHADSAKLDLRGTIAGTGRLVSYEELLLGDPLIDPVTGQPLTRLDEGVPMVVRGAPLVETMGGNATGHGALEPADRDPVRRNAEGAAAKRAPRIRRRRHGAPDHALLLNAAEKRLIVEWMDLGGQYYNNPFDGGIRAISTLSQASFETQVMPVLQASCAGCHQAIGSVAASSHAAAAEPLRAHRQRRGRLQRDAVDDLQHLLGRQQLSAEPAVERAASAGRQRPDQRAAAGGQRQLQRHRGVDRHRMSDTMSSMPSRRLHAVVAAIMAAAALSGCGGGENPFDNPADIENPLQVSGQKLSFAYFQKCINPIFLAQLQSSGTGAAGTNTCASSGCHDNVNGTGGALRIVPGAQAVDLADPANTADVIRLSDMYKNFYSAQGSSIIGSPSQSRLLDQAAAAQRAARRRLDLRQRRRTPTPS